MSVSRKKKTADKTINQSESLVRIFKAHKAVSADDIQLLTVMTIFKNEEKLFYGEYKSVIDALSVLEKRFPKIKKESIQYYCDERFCNYELIYPSVGINKLQIAVECWNAEIKDLVEFEQEGGFFRKRDALLNENECLYVSDDNQAFQNGNEFLKKMIICNGKPETLFKTVFGTLFVFWNDNSPIYSDDYGTYTFALFEHDRKISYAFLLQLIDEKV